MAVATVIHRSMSEYLDSTCIEACEKDLKGEVAAILGIATPLRFWPSYGPEGKGSISVEEDPVLRIKPRTTIAEALLRARRAYLEAGGQLLSWAELEAEISQLRGGLQEK